MTTTLHPSNASTTALQVLIIDPGVNDYQYLLSGAKAGVAVYLLDAQADGIQQITHILQRIRTDYGSDIPVALHVVSHGSPGCLYLGNQQLSLDTIRQYKAELSQWGLSASHIFLYGCRVALGDAGSELLTHLQNLTQATIHASQRLVGNAEQGGDWQLDQVVGTLAHEPRTLAFTTQTLNTYTSTFVAPEITNVAVDPSSPQNEGTTVTLNATFRDSDGVDPANYTATIDWGDETTTDITVINGGDVDGNGTGIFFFNVDHQYVDNAPDGAPYAITVTVNDTATDETDSATASFTINNVAPLINQANPTITIQEDTTTAGTVALTVTDPGDDTFTWQVVQTPQNGTASVDANGVVSYTPGINFSGSETFLVQVQDDDGATDNVAVTVNVAATNDAPNLLGDVALPAVDEDALNPTGTSVSNLVAPVFNDIDPNSSLAGIAVISNPANSTTQGRWQYSTNGGTNWFNVPSVSNTAALVLSANTLLRFRPAANYNGTPPALQVRAIDNSYRGSFTVGQTSLVVTNASNNGGSTAISSTTSNISVVVTPVNDPPVIDPTQDFAFEVSESAIAGDEIAILLADDIDSSTITWSIEDGNLDLDGDGNAAFAIDPATGTLTVNDADDLDFEGANSSFDLLIQATDEQGASDQETFTITVTDANDPPVIDPGQDLTFEVAEDEVTGTVIGSINATDPDPTDTLTWSIIGGNLDPDMDGTPVFSIDDMGQIAIADADDLDFETTSTYTLEVQVSDGELTDQVTVTVEVDNINEPPVIPVGQILTVEENAENGTVVGTVEANDPEGNITTWAITGGNTDADGDGINAFAINGTGTITVTDGDELDYESTSTYGIEVTVIDESGATTTELIQIDLDDVNESPTIPDGQTFTVSESAAFNTVVGTITGNDPDEADVGGLTWAILGGNPDPDGDQTPTFGINASTGTIFVADPDDLDFETDSSYTLSVRATDTAGNTDLATVTIQVDNENEPPDIPDGQSFSVDENTPDGTFFGMVEVLDPEENVTSWTIESGTNPDNDGDGVAAFGIDSTTGALFVADSGDLDFEAYDTSYTVTVQASDGESSDTADITIQIDNVNEPPVIVPDQLFTIPENSPVGTPVGQVSVSDPEGEPSNTFSWSITAESNPDLDGDGNAAFAIDSTGQILVNDADDLDFETAPNLYDLTIQAGDTGEEVGTAVVQVEVTDVNEPPVIDPDQTLSATLLENSANSTVVGTVTATDPDIGEVLNWSITNGNVDTDGDGTSAFLISDSGEITIADSDDLDFEANSTFDLELTVTDGEFSDVTNFTVTLTNVNEPPVVPADQVLTVPENSANGTEVGMVMVNDPEGNVTNWSITANNPDTDGDGIRLFQINSNGLITVADGDELDFETTSSYDLTVRAVDEEGETGSATVTIEVDNVNEPPSIMSGQTFTINENAEISTEIGFISAGDPEGDPLTWAIVGGNPDVDGDGVSAFGLNSQTGRLFVQDSEDLNYEFASNYTIDVQVTDSAGNTDTESVNIALNDINEAPAIAPNQVFNVDENSPVDTVFGDVVAADPEEDALTWTILSGNPDNDGDSTGAFSINANGELVVADRDDLNFEAYPTSYTLQVQVSDGEFSDTEAITVNVNNVNEPPLIPVGQVLTVIENSANGTVVGDVVATDPEGDNITAWTINNGNRDVDGDGTRAFAISNTGQITVADAGDLNFEVQPTFVLLVAATDANGAVGTRNVTVNLTDANDPPANLLLQPGTLRLSGQPYRLNGSFVDPDPADTHTVTINWGDGSSSTLDLPAGDVDFENISHIYDDPGNYSISVQVTDEDGATTSARQQAVIGNSQFPDFNRDALPDVVWRNDVTGQNSIWLLDDSNARTQVGALPPVTGANWQIEGVGDYDGDGQDDLVWRNSTTGQNSVWFMNGTNRVGTAGLPAVAEAGWQLGGVGDFSASSPLRDDLVWRNELTGQNVIWVMNGINRIGTIALDNVPGSDWEIAGVGNFDQDGQLDDLIWRNYETGQNVVWFVESDGTKRTQALDPLDDPNWRIEGASDFDGDGVADDLLWRNSVEGKTSVWFYNNGARVGTAPITPPVTNGNWSPVV
ncbi:MAG: cadherin domain-containing protein [Thainema sp.]